MKKKALIVISSVVGAIIVVCAIVIGIAAQFCRDYFDGEEIF